MADAAAPKDGHMPVADLMSNLKELASLKESPSAEEYTAARAELFARFCSTDGPQGGQGGRTEKKAAALSWDVGSMSKESMARVHPWAPLFVRSEVERARIADAFKSSAAWEYLETLMVERARAGTLAPLEIPLLSQLVCKGNKEWAAFFVANLILTTPHGTAYAVHNVDMLMRMEEGVRAAKAAAVLAYPGPIHHPSKTHDLNMGLLYPGGSEALLGGGVSPMGAFELEGLWGGTYLAPIVNAEGEEIGRLDLSDLEGYLGASQASTDKNFRELGGKLRKLLEAATTPAAPAWRRKKPQRKGMYGGGADGAGADPKN
ncbi:hypothetical protein NESM_000883400 [Novymonas esmeraldas]|uniref:Uncharacterized protein n=1 Tax=Novymonas esmeraldas TaxID=1808958 RepID=A0AAW0EYT6_9TRYP